MSTGLYSGMMRLTGPRVLFHASKNLHRLVMRGVDLNIKFTGSHRVLNTISFPRHLRSYDMLLTNIPVYEEMTKLAGVKGENVQTILKQWGPSKAIYETRWR